MQQELVYHQHHRIKMVTCWAGSRLRAGQTSYDPAGLGPQVVVEAVAHLHWYICMCYIIIVRRCVCVAKHIYTRSVVLKVQQSTSLTSRSKD